MLKLFDFGAQLQVFAEKRVTRLPVAFDQRVANKQLTGQRRVNLAVIHLACSNDRQAVNGDLFGRHHRALCALPVRFTV
ncbi:hypothetical protein D3C87_1975850 [compost metagenome]